MFRLRRRGLVFMECLEVGGSVFIVGGGWWGVGRDRWSVDVLNVSLRALTQAFLLTCISLGGVVRTVIGRRFPQGGIGWSSSGRVCTSTWVGGGVSSGVQRVASFFIPVVFSALSSRYITPSFLGLSVTWV